LVRYITNIDMLSEKFNVYHRKILGSSNASFEVKAFYTGISFAYFT